MTLEQNRGTAVITGASPASAPSMQTVWRGADTT